MGIWLSACLVVLLTAAGELLIIGNPDGSAPPLNAKRLPWIYVARQTCSSNSEDELIEFVAATPGGAGPCFGHRRYGLRQGRARDAGMNGGRP